MFKIKFENLKNNNNLFDIILYYLFNFVKYSIILSLYINKINAKISPGTVIIKRFSKEHCETKPCMNGGICIPGKIACDCAPGWMGQYCHRKFFYFF